MLDYIVTAVIISMHLNKHQIGEFLYSHFNIENEGNTLHFWHIMFYCFKKGKNTIKIQEKICAVYGEGAVIDQMCPKWFVKFLGPVDLLAK